MQRGQTGHWVASVAGGEACRAFVPRALPPEPPLALGGEVQQALDAAHIALGRLDAVSVLLPETQLFLYSYVRKEAVMSSRIEGTQSSLADLMLYEADAMPGVPLDDAQEVSCYVQALDLGIRRIREGWPITERLILELHATLLRHGRGIRRAPGEFRRTQNWIGGPSPGRAAFVPPPPNELPTLWSNLERFLNDVPDSTPPLMKAALAHVQFETLHPFLDGNGRLGRMLIPLILVQAGVLREPLLYLSLYFKTHREAYYSQLQQVREEGDWEAWLVFFSEAVRATAHQAVQTAQQLNRLLAEDRQKLQALGKLSGSAFQTLEALFAQPVTTAARISERTGLTPATVNRTLAALENELGIVSELTGRRRGRVYGYTRYVAILNEELTDL